MERRVPLKEAMNVPGTSRPTDIPGRPELSKDALLEIVRKTDRVIYDDDTRIITMTEWEAGKGKRLRVVVFKDNKLVRWKDAKLE